jgi:hypothetical protein
MLGRSPSILFVALLLAGLLATVILPALADETYSLDKDFTRANSGIVIHLICVNVTDKYMGNVYPSQAPEETKWAHLVYQYENTGNVAEVGHIQYELIDSNGSVYKFNPNQDEYSGVLVQPHSRSDIRWNEIPIPKDVVLARVRVFEGVNPDFLLANETYDLHLAAGPTSSATPAGPSSGTPSTTRYVCCMPLLPFAIMASLGIVGLYMRSRGVKK